MAARNFPNTIWRGFAGVSSSGSRVARSRSPLMLSAPMTIPTKSPKEMPLRIVRNAVSTGGIRSSPLSSSRRTEVTDITRVKRINSSNTRPPVHRSMNSRLNTNHHTGGPTPRRSATSTRSLRCSCATLMTMPLWLVPDAVFVGPRRRPCHSAARRTRGAE